MKINQNRLHIFINSYKNEEKVRGFFQKGSGLIFLISLKGIPA